MTITNYDIQRVGNAITVTVTSDVEPGAGEVIYFHWYMDGAWVGRSLSPSKTFYLDGNEQVRIICQDTLNSAYDPIANAPDGWPARRSIFWVQSMASDIKAYRVEQRANAGSWVTIAYLHHQDSRWSYSALSPRLTDLASYEWRVIPIDTADNDGTAIAFDAMTLVRRPDAPDFSISFDDGTARVTFSAA